VVANNRTENNLYAIVTNGDYAVITGCKILNNTTTRTIVGVDVIGEVNYAYEIRNISFLGNMGRFAIATQIHSFRDLIALSGSLLIENCTSQHNKSEIYHGFNSINNGKVPLTFTVVLDNFKSLNNTGESATFDMTLCDRSVVQNCVVQHEALAVSSGDLKLSLITNRVLYCTRTFAVGANTSLCNNIVIV
jgi:hypothetical protein